jgi:hypothetical protein
MREKHTGKGVPAQHNMRRAPLHPDQIGISLIQLMVDHRMPPKGIMQGKPLDVHDMPVDKPLEETAVCKEADECENLPADFHALCFCFPEITEERGATLNPALTVRDNSKTGRKPFCRNVCYGGLLSIRGKQVSHTAGVSIPSRRTPAKCSAAMPTKIPRGLYHLTPTAPGRLLSDFGSNRRAARNRSRR